MIKKFIPVFLPLVGLGVGISAGVVMSPSKDAEHSTQAAKAETSSDKAGDAKPHKVGKEDGKSEFEYLPLTKQFVIPVVDADRIEAMVTMSLSLEITRGMTEAFYALEPKLRDGFLQVMFDHANTGGFDGFFTESDNLKVLRKALLETARKDLGDDVSQILIMSVSRQDV